MVCFPIKTSGQTFERAHAWETVNLYAGGVLDAQVDQFR